MKQNKETYKQKIEAFIDNIKNEFDIEDTEYRDHVLLLMLQGFLAEEDEIVAFLTFYTYDNLDEEAYKEIFEYTKTLDRGIYNQIK